LSTYYKCNLLDITHKLNVSEHILIRTFFLHLVCGIRARSLSAPLIYTLYKIRVPIFSTQASILQTSNEMK
jgi:hypothetical protein